jgi:hypothetical protein
MIICSTRARSGHAARGTGNKTERLFGYFTWHADDSPPVNPLGDLFKTQVWALVATWASRRHRRQSPPAPISWSADRRDRLRHHLRKADASCRTCCAASRRSAWPTMGFKEGEVALVKKRLDSTHWKRHLPTTAMLSSTSIGDYYLRPGGLLKHPPLSPEPFFAADATAGVFAMRAVFPCFPPSRCRGRPHPGSRGVSDRALRPARATGSGKGACCSR